jgi:hypothetical protein
MFPCSISIYLSTIFISASTSVRLCISWIGRSSTSVGSIFLHSIHVNCPNRLISCELIWSVPRKCRSKRINTQKPSEARVINPHSVIVLRSRRAKGFVILLFSIKPIAIRTILFRIVSFLNRKASFPNRMISIPYRKVPFPNRMMPIRYRKVSIPNRNIAIPNRMIAIRYRNIAIPNRMMPVRFGNDTIPNRIMPVRFGNDTIPNRMILIPDRIDQFRIGIIQKHRVRIFRLPIQAVKHF